MRTSVGYERQEYVYIQSYSGKELSQSGVCDNSFLFGDYMNGPRQFLRTTKRLLLFRVR